MQEYFLLISFTWNRSKIFKQALWPLTLLNHQLLSLILDKISFFFSNCLIGRKTKYLWNNFIFSLFNVDVGIEQGFALSFILLALYITPLFHIFEKRSKNLKISKSLFSFVNNRLLTLQEKSFEKTNTLLFCSYTIISSLLNQFGLMVEHRKFKVFHFSKLYGIFNLSPFNLSLLGGLILCPKDTWKYLGFIFDRKLSFQQHVNFYSNKALLTVKCMKMLENLTRGLLSYQSDFYIEYVSFPLCYIVFPCNSLIRPLFCILSRNSGKYNKELLFGSWVLFTLLLHRELKLLLV